MKASLLAFGAVAACIGLAGCDRGHANPKDGVIQTKFPGQVTAGGLTSGQVMARSAKPETNAVFGGGSPFIAGGSGGNTGGTAMGGSVTETGQGPSRATTEPTGAMKGGKNPLSEGNGQGTAAPAAAGSATNVEKTAPNAATPGQQASPPAAPGTLTGGK